MKNKLIIFQVIFLLTISLGIGIFSCTMAVPDLSEYRGVNFIANHKFSYYIPMNKNSWYFDDIAENGHHYMAFTFNPLTATPIDFAGIPSHITSGATLDDVARLEIFNLAKNGGFEDSNLSYWITDPSGANILSRSNAPPNVHGSGNYSLHYKFSAGHTSAGFDLNTIKDGFIPGQSYIIRLNFTKSLALMPTFLNFNNDPLWQWIPRAKTGWDNPIYTRFPYDANLNTNIIAPSNTINFFNIMRNDDIGSETEGYIDDFRIVRSNINYYLELRVPYSETGRPNLVSGRYRFSVWVKAEADEDVSPYAPNEDRFRSTTVSLGIGRASGAKTIRSFDASVDPNIVTESVLSKDSWKQLYIEQFFQIGSGDSLKLLISPTSINNLDIGSVLVALPTLEYISN